ncbi:MAG: hypothetical protein R6W78_17745, partial [Bacteroidales bacterium]
MKSKLIILLLFILTAHRESFTQSDGYDVTLAPFSTRTNDEFSPVYYNNGIVYCSTLKNNSLIVYKNQKDKFFNIFYAELKNDSGLKNTRLFAKELSTNFNDGPVTFTESGEVIFYCRNNKIPNYYKDFSDSSNTPGLFSAVKISGIWTDIQPFAYNSLS